LLFLIALAILSLFLVSCAKDDDKITNTNFNFTGMDQYYEWYWGHTWMIGTNVYSEPQPFGGKQKSDPEVMYIYPNVVCSQDSVVSLSDTYELTINGVVIPLLAEGSPEPAVSVNYDLIEDDIAIPKSNILHYIFMINGEVIINKTVFVPSDVSMETPNFDDLSLPQTVSWQMNDDVDSQILEVGAAYRPNPGNSYGYSPQYLISNNERSCQFDCTDMLAYFTNYLGEQATPDKLEIYYAVILAKNIEEQGSSLVYAAKKSKWSVTGVKEQLTFKTE
jgi:hypothetical protein